jgi:N-acetylmuramoyl-L-alanine amidase
MTQCKNRRPLKPLDKAAVKKADRAQPSCGNLSERTKWMNAYISAGGAWECADPAYKKPDECVASCPNETLNQHGIKVALAGVHLNRSKPDAWEEKGYGREFFSGELSDTRCVEGSLDNGGMAEYQEIPDGMCEFEFYDFYAYAKKKIESLIGESYSEYIETVDHIPRDTPDNRRPGHAMKPICLTIHSTGNSRSNAKNERAWLTNKSNNRTASYHLVVDEKEMIECIPLNESAWHSTDGNGVGNRKTIGMEICESGNREKTLNNAISAAAKILKDNGWGVSKLRRHHDWYRAKKCPRILIMPEKFGGAAHQTWEWFKKEVSKKLKQKK